MGPVATLTPDPSSPSPTPSPASLRQWRPAAQRNLRNQWSRLLAAKARWLAAATDGRSHASALVNAHLSRSYMPGMDLGVLKDMPGIRDRASTKLARKEEQCRGMLLSAYKEMVLAVCDLVKASRAMRCFSKISSSSPLVRFTDHQDDLNDSGDGGGAPVYKWFSMLEFESLAQELIEMFVSELHLKRLIVLELLSINLKEGAEEHHPSLEWSDELYDGELYEFQGIGFLPGDSFPLPENWSADVLQARRPGHTLSHDVLQRAIFILMLTSVPLAFVLGFTGQILIALGQNPEISYEAGLYARWLIPGLFAYGLLQCLTKFLQAQNVVHPLVVCSGVTLVLHILLCWFLVQYFGLGNRGAALATSISYWFNVILLGMYVKLSEAGRRSWHGWSREVLKDVNMYLRLAIPSTFMTCLEYWAFEMVVLLAGFLPNPKLETSILSISLNTMWMVYTIPSGLSSAISIRVSNELGAGNPQAARLSILISGIMSLTEGVLVVIITFSVRDVWGYLYSNEEEVVKYVSTMMPILATSDFMDGIQCTLSGAARGCGWQKACSFINLCSYYAIGIPSAVIFAFVLKIGGKGLWLGIICAMVVQILALLVMMLRTSWDKEAEKALARTRVQGSDGRRTLA